MQAFINEITDHGVDLIGTVMIPPDVCAEYKCYAIFGVDKRKGVGSTVPPELTHGGTRKGDDRIAVYSAAKAPAVAVQTSDGEIVESVVMQ